LVVVLILLSSTGLLFSDASAQVRKTVYTTDDWSNLGPWVETVGWEVVSGRQSLDCPEETVFRNTLPGSKAIYAAAIAPVCEDGYGFAVRPGGIDTYIRLDFQDAIDPEGIGIDFSDVVVEFDMMIKTLDKNTFNPLSSDEFRVEADGVTVDLKGSLGTGGLVDIPNEIKQTTDELAEEYSLPGIFDQPYPEDVYRRFQFGVENPGSLSDLDFVYEVTGRDGEYEGPYISEVRIRATIPEQEIFVFPGGSNAEGLEVSVVGDGVNEDWLGGSGPQAIPTSWRAQEGTVIEVEALSPQVDPLDDDTRYVFDFWGGAGAPANDQENPFERLITGFQENIFAHYDTQHRLTVNDPSGGQILVSPSSVSGFYDEGTSVTLEAVADNGFFFDGWIGDANGGSITSVTMSEPRTVGANFELLPELSVSPSGPVDVPANGENVTFEVFNTGGGSLVWSASTNRSWAQIISGGSGTNDGTFVVSIQDNPSLSSRSATVSVNAGPNGSQSITINQEGADPDPAELVVTPESRSVGSEGETTTFEVSNAGDEPMSWSASSDASWASITSGESGTDEGTIEVTVAENTSLSSREATITVDAEEAGTETVTVAQSGADPDPAELVVTPDSCTVGPEGETTTFEVSNAGDEPMSWSASSDASWASITSGESGTDEGTIEVAVGENTSLSSREATITVDAGEAGTEAVTVTQAGADATPAELVVTPESRSVGSEGETTTFEVSNAGDEPMSWSASSDASWASITSGESGTDEDTIEVTVAENTNLSSRQATITVDAGEAGSKEVTITQAGASTPEPIPSVALNPEELQSEQAPDRQIEVTLTVSNNGDAGSALAYSFPSFAAESLLAQHTTDANTTTSLGLNRNLRKGEDPHAGEGHPVLLGAGGPDSYGYTWVDSNEDGGAAFGWVDVSSEGNEVADLAGTWDENSPVAIPFSFPFYGDEYTEVWVSVNGWINFDGFSGLGYTNKEIPSSGEPHNFIAAFWDDLDMRSQGTVHTYHDEENGRFIIQWTDVEKSFNSGSSLTFQAQLYSNGSIRLQYLDMNGAMNASTVGIEAPEGTDGLQVAFNTDYIKNGLAIDISATPEFITAVEPSSGNIASGSSETVAVTFDSEGLSSGIYTGLLNLSTNDPESSTVGIPAMLTVQEDAGMVPQPTSQWLVDENILEDQIGENHLTQNSEVNTVMAQEIDGVTAGFFNGSGSDEGNSNTAFNPNGDFPYLYHDSPILSDNIPITISGWVKIDPDLGHPSALYYERGTWYGRSQVGVSPDYIRYEYGDNSATRRITTDGLPTSLPNGWHHIVTTRDEDGIIRLWVNNQYMGQADTNTGSSSAFSTRIGATRNGGQYFIGHIHNLSVWDGWEAESSDVAELFNNSTLSQDDPPVDVAEIAVSATAVDFGPVEVGQSADETLTIENTGEAPLEGEVTIEGAGYSLTSGGGAFTLAAGASRAVEVTFAPEAAGSFTGTVAITHDADNEESPLEVALNGDGLAPAIAIAPEAIAFGTVVAGASRTETLLIENTGDTFLEGDVRISRGPDVFSLTAGSGDFSVAPGDTQEVEVTFAPGAAGSFEGAVAISHNAGNASDPVEVNITGDSEAAPAPEIAVSTTAVDFGPVEVGQRAEASVTIDNTGSAPLQVSLSGAEDPFSLSGTATAFSLAPGEAGDIGVAFVPEGGGSFEGTLSIAHEADNEESPIEVELMGQGTPAAEVPITASRVFDDATDERSYRLVGLPGQIDTDLAETLPGEAGSTWRAFRETGADGESPDDYLDEYRVNSGDFRFRPGRGFWLLSTNEWVVDQIVDAVDLTGEGLTTVPLHDGWNIFSNPLDQPVAWDETLGLEANSSLTEALWQWDGSWQSADTLRSARTGEAYYLFNNGNLEALTLQHPAFVEDEEGDLIAAAREQRAELQLIAETRSEANEERQEAARLTLGHTAGDAIMHRLPPAHFAAAQLAARSGEVDAPLGRLLEATPEAGDGLTFDVQLTGVAEGEAVYFSAEGLGAFDGDEIVLVNVATGARHDLRAYSSDNPVRIRIAEGHLTGASDDQDGLLALQLLIGDQAFVDEAAERPEALTLGPVYPNPSSGEVTVEVAVPEAMNVRVELFNVLGQQVGLLHSGELTPGVHELRWDGRTASGAEAASGVYLIRLIGPDGAQHTERLTRVR
jgi:hypothetical protein